MKGLVMKKCPGCTSHSLSSQEPETKKMCKESFWSYWFLNRGDLTHKVYILQHSGTTVIYRQFLRVNSTVHLLLHSKSKIYLNCLKTHTNASLSFLC